MKMGAFLVGGLVGAAAVLYMSRGKNSMMLSSITGNTFSKAMGKAKNKFSGNAEGNQKMSGNASGNNLDGISDVEKIIKQDKDLNNQVQQILSENNQSGYATQ
jgi:gas vesicle protein